MTLPTGDPSQERLNELFEYRDGKLYNKTNRSPTARKGAMAGTTDIYGYTLVTADFKRHRVHRLIYIMHNGNIPEKMFIDHRNGIRDDNRIDNLRVVTKQENSFNTHSKGYSWDKKCQKWQARIMVDGVNKHLGFFVNEEDAIQAYQDGKEKYHIIEYRS
ncbi:MAG: HNH endonuclease [Candidatus Marinimicrobia bacterium]|jgi:hypothetical protein|nr:HNH endonuclease [Candidatus Neomarinimicrobiota bacterium]